MSFEEAPAGAAAIRAILPRPPFAAFAALNFLAHLHLTPPTPSGRLGAMLGDFVKGPLDRSGYDDAIVDAIRLHRAIDTFTDAHPVVREAKTLISPGRRRFAGILLDLYFDQRLAVEWAERHATGLETFAAEVYEHLAGADVPLPERLARMLPVMIGQNWLVSYRSFDGLAAALDGMSRRRRIAAPIEGAARELHDRRDDLSAAFHEFFPALVRHVESLGAGAFIPAAACR